MIDLPTNLSIEEVVRFFKGSSSHWLNENHQLPEKFAWGRGCGAFSVSASGVGEVSSYIASQECHHQSRTFAEELSAFVQKYGLQWMEETSNR